MRVSSCDLGTPSEKKDMGDIVLSRGEGVN